MDGSYLKRTEMFICINFVFFTFFNLEKAERLLKRIEELEHITPDSRTYTKVIQTWSRASKFHEDAPERAISLLRRIEEAYHHSFHSVMPNVFIYTAVIEACANAGEATKAVELFDELEALYEASNHNDIDLKPTVRTFNAVLNAWGNISQSNADAAHHAEAILYRMSKLYYKKGITECVKPNRVNYNTCIDAWAKAGSARKAEKLLQKMEQLYEETGDEELKPSVRDFNTVLDAYAKSIDAVEPGDAAKQAERLIRQMEQLSECDDCGIIGKNTDVKPNTRSYNSLINAYAKCNTDPEASQKAESVLLRMETKYKSTLTLGKGDVTVRPDFYSFATVIHAIARSNQRKKAEKAYQILCDMNEKHSSGENVYAQPNVIIYNAVLNACAFSSNDDEDTQQRAMEIAHQTFKELRQIPNIDPDEVSYGTFIKACANLMPHGSTVRDTVVEALFRKCCEDGLVGEMVIRQMYVACSSKDVYMKLMGYLDPQNKFLSVKDMPKKWTRNIQRGIEKRKR